MNQTRTYRTSDYQIAVILSATSHKLLALDKTNPSRTVFEFESEEGTETLVEAYFRDELALNPRLVLMNARSIKDRLHAGY